MAVSGECVKFPETIDAKFVAKVKLFFNVVRERPWVVYSHFKEFEFFRDYLRSVERLRPKVKMWRISLSSFIFHVSLHDHFDFLIHCI
jgi:hypothetical protein